MTKTLSYCQEHHDKSFLNNYESAAGVSSIVKKYVTAHNVHSERNYLFTKMLFLLCEGRKVITRSKLMIKLT